MAFAFTSMTDTVYTATFNSFTATVTFTFKICHRSRRAKMFIRSLCTSLFERSRNLVSTDYEGFILDICIFSDLLISIVVAFLCSFEIFLAVLVRISSSRNHLVNYRLR